jgi:zinc/manganese transport system substrate-binding protein
MKKIMPHLLLALVVAEVSTAQADLKIASLSTVTTDLAKQIGGNHVTVEGIIKPGIDPHEFEPTPGDVKKVADADLVLLTGKGMEGYLSKLEEAAGGSAKFLNEGKDIPSLTMTEQGKKVEDPHWWHSVENMKRATRIMSEEFVKADPVNASSYLQNETAYLAKLDELERWIRVKVAGLSHDRRKLVTSHDALGYFAHDYGFTIYPVKGVSTAEDSSSQHVKAIIGVIKSQGVKAIFLENIENPRAVEQIAEETGTKAGGSLYSDGLGESEGNTYESMMRHNVSAIVEGLK